MNKLQIDSKLSLKDDAIDYERICFAHPPKLRYENEKPEKQIESKLSFVFRVFHLFVIAEGFEPSTACLEGRCSIQLSYATAVVTFDRLLRRQVALLDELRNPKNLSGWQDSNLRPPGPKPGAMTGLRYTPRQLFSIHFYC